MQIEIRGQSFELIADRAIFWQAEEMLIIGDLHLGKIAHFNKNGIALPREVVLMDIERLQALIDSFKPKVFCVLGDLFHSDYNSEWNLFRSFRESNQRIEFFLIKGNHDRLHPSFYSQLPMKVMQAYTACGIKLIHESVEGADEFQISAHIHPAYTLKGKGKQALRFSCFYQKKDEFILPAFGRFTGTHQVKKKKGELIYALAGDKIIEIC